MLNKIIYFKPLVVLILLFIYTKIIAISVNQSAETYYYILKFIIDCIIIIVGINTLNFLLIYLKSLIKSIISLFQKNKDSIFSIFNSIELKIRQIKSIYLMIILTLLWLSFITFLINIQESNSGIDKLVKVNNGIEKLVKVKNGIGELVKVDENKLGLTLNEWGDFFAGFIAPLALVWLAFSIYYQKEEFENVKIAFIDQQSILQDQLTQLHIEKLHTWFDRNTKIINSLLSKLSESKDPDKNTPLKINNDLNPNTHDKYINIYDKIHSIINVNEYIHTYLSSVSSEIDVSITINELKEEYKILFEKDILYCRYILIKVYLLISISDQEDYKKYQIYDDWIDDSNSDLRENLKRYINNHESISDNFSERLGQSLKNISNSQFMENI